MDTLIYFHGDLQVYFLGSLQMGNQIYGTYSVGLVFIEDPLWETAILHDPRCLLFLVLCLGLRSKIEDARIQVAGTVWAYSAKFV